MLSVHGSSVLTVNDSGCRLVVLITAANGNPRASVCELNNRALNPLLLCSNNKLAAVEELSLSVSVVVLSHLAFWRNL